MPTTMLTPQEKTPNSSFKKYTFSSQLCFFFLSLRNFSQPATHPVQPASQPVAVQPASSASQSSAARAVQPGSSASQAAQQRAKQPPSQQTSSQAAASSAATASSTGSTVHDGGHNALNRRSKKKHVSTQRSASRKPMSFL